MVVRPPSERRAASEEYLRVNAGMEAPSRTTKASKVAGECGEKTLLVRGYPIEKCEEAAALVRIDGSQSCAGDLCLPWTEKG